MPLESISLRKLLKIGFSTPNRRRAELRGIIRQDRAKAAGAADEGGDFYAGFWADARAHVFGTQDLHESTAERVAGNRNRQRLYPLLRDGFLRWWSTYRRHTNEPFQLGPSQRTRFEILGLASMVKVESILSITDGSGGHHYVYPYFAEAPELSLDAAKLGLWLLGQALPEIPPERFQLLDVLRGRAFSITQTPLQGDEEQLFLRMYAGLIQERDGLRRMAEE
uniref:Protein of unassigned function n=1 Tax=Methylobacterium oryzae CBMB20 TaxID=693986 RepID=A0A088B356_9HYPH|nr:hypothetical protein [Methylobacterium oryzae]AGO88401.1 protein of unassigned function [Methylobacterium oryzae CBMB20]